jgi:hypothetical protein
MYNSYSSPTVTDCWFSGNSAAAEGGGMSNYVSNPTVTNCTFEGNHVLDGAGGGMSNQYSSPTVTDCTFIENTTTPFYGGGMYNANSSNPTVTNCTFTGNVGGYEGGGMYTNQFCSPTVTDCTFSGNTAGAGGGMSNQNSALTVTNCTFSGNTAQHGGGIRNYNGSSPTVTGCTFTGNDGGVSGGGMFNFESSPTVTDCAFTSNSASRGAGMFNQQGSHPTVTGCDFASNEGEYGGGMYNAYGSNSTVTNCTFRYNTAGWFGGGMDNKLSAPTVTNCTFTSNGGLFGGGMFNEENASPTVINCTFIDNDAGYGGGMFSKVNSSPTVANCILWGDTPEEILLENSTITVTYSNVQGGWVGTGNIDADPTFADADGRLSPGSPCIDAADNTAVPADTEDLDGDENTTEPIPFDLDGNPRFVDDIGTPDTGFGDPPIVDMGAYEFQGTTGTIIDFDPPQTFPADGEANRQAVGDLDGNGTADVVTVLPNEEPQLNGDVQVFLNQGTDPDGVWLGLVPKDPVPVGRDPSGVAVGFLNADLHLDVAVSNAGDNTVSILFNAGTGNGDLLPAVNYDAGIAPSAIVADDFNEDGFIDLAVTSAGDQTVVVLFNDGTGDFSGGQATAPVAINLAISPFSLAVDDLDDNKDPDLFGSGASAGAAGLPGVVFVLIGQPGGSFEPAVLYEVGLDPQDVTSGDLDLDGDSDLAAANTGDATVSVLLNQGDGSFTTAFAQAIGADDPEIGPAVQVLANLLESGELVFEADPDAFDVSADPNFVVSADFNDDGLADLVTVNADDGQTDGSVTVLLADPIPFSAGVAFDIRPGGCPNPLNMNSRGVLPTALVGTAGFDVTQVDPGTILLSRADGVGGAVAPNEGPPGPPPVLEDVATPFTGEPCDCDELPADGIMDLSMSFWSNDVIQALELDDLPAGAFVELELRGALLNGTEFAGRDCVRLLRPGDMDGDGTVGVADLLALLAGWGSCPAPPADCIADINGDGNVGVPDLLAVLAGWGSYF